LYCVTVFFWTVPLSNRVVVDSVVAFGGTTTTGSVTTGAEVTIAGGGVTGVTSRVVVSLTVRSVEQLDIQPSERPTQVANAMFVMIFIMNTPVVNRRVAPEPTREERDGLGVYAATGAWRTLRAILEYSSNHRAGTDD
jgi:hypothetical protein